MSHPLASPLLQQTLAPVILKLCICLFPKTLHSHSFSFKCLLSLIPTSKLNTFFILSNSCVPSVVLPLHSSNPCVHLHISTHPSSVLSATTTEGALSKASCRTQITQVTKRRGLLGFTYKDGAFTLMHISHFSIKGQTKAITECLIHCMVSSSLYFSLKWLLAPEMRI